MMESIAHFNPERTRRYYLYRTWDEPLGIAMFIGLNPSIADETKDDPTIRKCVGFAKRWGYGGIAMLNLCNIIGTNPKDVTYPGDNMSTEDGQILLCHAEEAKKIIACWGAQPDIVGRAADAIDMFSTHRVKLWCLGKTKSGAPKHPLYIPYDRQLEPYPGE